MNVVAKDQIHFPQALEVVRVMTRGSDREKALLLLAQARLAELGYDLFGFLIDEEAPANEA